jgi:HEAT repeat protein
MNPLIALLVRTLPDHHAEDESAAQAAFQDALGQLEPEQVVASLAPALASTDPALRKAAAFELGRLRHKAAVALLLPLLADLQNLQDPAPQVRAGVGLALGELRADRAGETTQHGCQG